MVESMAEVAGREKSGDDSSDRADVNVEETVREILEKHDPQGLRALAPEEYLMWSVSSPRLPSAFCRLVFRLCHVALGLRPASRRDEAEIIRGWMDETGKDALTVGSVWYLLNADWWRHWNAYVDQGAATNSPR